MRARAHVRMWRVIDSLNAASAEMEARISRLNNRAEFLEKQLFELKAGPLPVVERRTVQPDDYVYVVEPFGEIDDAPVRVQYRRGGGVSSFSGCFDDRYVSFDATPSNIQKLSWTPKSVEELSRRSR